jgi:hypothetical protein
MMELAERILRAVGTRLEMTEQLEAALYASIEDVLQQAALDGGVKYGRLLSERACFRGSEGEMGFLLRSQDSIASQAICQYRAAVMAFVAQPERANMLFHIDEFLGRFEAWQSSHSTKLPDTKQLP